MRMCMGQKETSTIDRSANSAYLHVHCKVKQSMKPQESIVKMETLIATAKTTHALLDRPNSNCIWLVIRTRLALPQSGAANGILHAQRWWTPAVDDDCQSSYAAASQWTCPGLGRSRPKAWPQLLGWSTGKNAQAIFFKFLGNWTPWRSYKFIWGSASELCQTSQLYFWSNCVGSWLWFLRQ